MRDGKVILIHGFSNEEAFRVMRAVKAAVADPGDIAFAVSTPTNLDWRIRDLVDQVRLDHEYMKQNPPDPRKGIND
ncbi:MAG TPA: DUF3783 domain-containing protein [Spirochaetia bacterium]|nr:DUF3783 domain-containing protein [Spirochaetia bacterium]